MTPLRALALLAGVLMLLLGAGYALNLPLATATWPWPDGPLSYLFVGSILAAIAAALIWIGLSGEWASMQAGAITSGIISAGFAVYLLLLQNAGREGLTGHILYFIAVAAISAGAFIWSRRFSFHDNRPLPPLVRYSYIVFAAVLLLVGLALVLQTPAVFPWPLNPDSSVLFGLIFLGDAAYFACALLVPRWHSARAQLLSFLAYDLFLIPPFALHFGAVAPGHLLSLLLYMAVLLYSAGLAVYYLFVAPETRNWSAAQDGP